MREHSSLWIAVVVAGGLLLAGLAGLGGLAMFKTRTAVRANAELERRAADPQQAKDKGPAPADPGPKATEPPAQPPANPTAGERWAKADVRDYATKIYQDYQGNAVAADNKYQGRMVGLVGEVVKVDIVLGKEVLLLKAADLGFAELSELSPSLWCYCDKSERDRLASLSAGHWVAVVGTCKGKGKLSGMVELEGCALVHATATEAEMKRSFQQK
jgi:hypothetical protein